MVHTALGHLLLSKENNTNVKSDNDYDAHDNNNNNNSDSDQDSDIKDEADNKNRKKRIDRCLRLNILERAAASFRRAMDAAKFNNHPFVPATRGLAVALCRRRLMLEPTAAGNALHKNNNDGESQEVRSVFGGKDGIVICHRIVICHTWKRFCMKFLCEFNVTSSNSSGNGQDYDRFKRQ